LHKFIIGAYSGFFGLVKPLYN